jgi:hypothetical protein
MILKWITKISHGKMWMASHGSRIRPVAGWCEHGKKHSGSYNKSKRDALFLKFIFDKELYMFLTDLLPIIRSLNAVCTAIGIYHASYIDCLLARSGWNCSSILTSLADSRSVRNM